MSDILLRQREGGVVLAMMNRPEKLNALNTELRKALHDFWLDFRDDPSKEVAIVAGAGKAFSAGRDLKETASVEAGGGRLSYQLTGEQGYPGDLALGKPVIAAVAGHCLGAGLKIALGCDIRICAGSARFGNPQVRQGQGTDMPYLLSRAGLPRSIVMHMALTGEPLDAEQALRWGLVSHLLPQDELIPTAWAVARRIAENSRTVVSGIKRASETGLFELPTKAALALWPVVTGMMGQTQDRREGALAFVEKRAPKF